MRLPALALVLLILIATSASAQPWVMPKSDFGGAIPLNRNTWYNFNDYPTDAMRAGEEGYVTVSFTIGTDGRMSECHVARSSGYADLDRIPCKVLPGRARFSPAKDASGAAVATHGATSMAFWVAG
jgi:TonB family protein